MTTLLEIAGADTALKQKTTGGKEYAGACPWCGGEDRFMVWPEEGETGRWWCRQCDRKGDGPGYLMARDGLSYPKALDALGLPTSPGRRQRPRSATPAEPTGPLVAEDEAPPPEKWQEKARAFAAWAQEQLWSDAGEKARAYLREARGLDDGHIIAANLGYNPTCLYRPASKWGIEGNKVYLSRGIVIPAEADGVMWYVQVRRIMRKGDELHRYIGGEVPWNPDPEKPTKYWAVRGGAGKALYLADYLRGNGRPLLWCEGEFDALLATKELGDLVDVATLGGAAKANQGLPGRWLFRLSPYPVILAAFDRDKAGEAGAGRLAKLSRRIRPIKVPHGDDLTDFHRGGGDLRVWLSGYLGQLATSTPGGDNSVARANQFCHHTEHAGANTEHAEDLAGDAAPEPETVNLSELLNEAEAAGRQERPCYVCGGVDWWQRPAEVGGGWVCARCHPAAVVGIGESTIPEETRHGLQNSTNHPG